MSNDVREAPGARSSEGTTAPATGSVAPSNAQVQLRALMRGRSFDEQVQMLAPADAGNAPTTFSLDPIRPVDPTANLVEDAADPEGARDAEAPDHASAAEPARAAAPGGKPATDPAVLSLTQQNSMPNTLPIPGGKFGGMSPSFEFDGISIKHEPGKAWQVSANLKVICAWGVSDNGRTNITGPHDPKITRTNYRSVADDLDPALGDEPPGKPTRNSYYSRFWTAEHEWFHARDTWGWVSSQGVEIAKKVLAKATISSEEDVRQALSRARTALDDGWRDWFGFYESSEAAKPGEQRAYLDGKPHYEAIARETRERDKDLR